MLRQYLHERPTVEEAVEQDDKKVTEESLLHHSATCNSDATLRRYCHQTDYGCNADYVRIEALAKSHPSTIIKLKIHDFR